ncbi:MAG: DUF2147 domain-containing protein [Burkholderiales bacterium]|nr:DUF2147 domain-containing protein [Burkholderiales bacterium]
MKKPIQFLFAALVGGIGSLTGVAAHAQQPGLSDYYLATIEAKAQVNPQGHWITQSGNLEVEISACGKELCGTVARVLANNAMSADTATQNKVADAKGMKIMTGFAKSDIGEWTGKIFNRQNGQTYDCVVRAMDDDHLEVRPYQGDVNQGQTQIWTRLPAATASAYTGL